MQEKKIGLIAFSGGETSAFLLYYLLKTKSDEYDFKIIFANTGRENNETLEFVKQCAEYFKCEIIWLEAVIRFKVRSFGNFKIFDSFEEKEAYLNSYNKEELEELEIFKIDKKTGKPIYRLRIEEVDCGTIHKVVNYETATRNQDWKHRNDTPYEMMVKKYGLANINNNISTRELKERPIHSYMKSLGYNKRNYTTFIGIRADEFDRMSVNKDKLNIKYPLISWKPTTKKHINFFWNTQPFRLKLKGWEGNCVTCYKKSIDKLTQIMIDNSWKFEFDEYIENKYGHYIPLRRKLHIIKNNKQLPEFPINIFRNNYTVKMIKDRAENFNKKIIDDSQSNELQLNFFDEEESCEVFSQCGIDN